MDSKDFRLLVALHQNARQSYQSLGRYVSLTAPAVRERLRRLQSRGILQGFGLWIDSSYFDRDEILVFIPPERTREDVAKALAAPDVAWVAWKLEGGLTVGLWSHDRKKAIEGLAAALGVQPSGNAFTERQTHDPLSLLDWQVIDALVDDPRRPLKGLMKSTGLSPKTIRKHLESLLQSEIISIEPREGPAEGAGELVYHLAVAGNISMEEIRNLMGQVTLIHQPKTPPMKYLLCRSTDLSEVTTKIRALTKLPGVESANVTLNQELLFSGKFIHSLVREQIQNLEKARKT